MKLFYTPGACSLTPHIVMAELNMVYELDMVNLSEKTCTTGDFRLINPKGSVPALKMEDGEVLTEAAVICQYLTEQTPGNTMLGKFGTMERTRTLEWMNYIATEIHKNFTPVFAVEKMFKNTETQTEVKNFYKNSLNLKFAYLSEKLGQNDYLTGKEFTIADAYLFTCLSWTRYVGMDLTPWSNLTGFMKRVSERPAVMKAMKEEGLLK